MLDFYYAKTLADAFLGARAAFEAASPEGDFARVFHFGQLGLTQATASRLMKARIMKRWLKEQAALRAASAPPKAREEAPSDEDPSPEPKETLEIGPWGEVEFPQAGEEGASVAPEAALSKEPKKKRTPRVDWAQLLRRTFVQREHGHSSRGRESTKGTRNW